MESARIDCAVRGRDFNSVLEAIAKRGESGSWRGVVVAGDCEMLMRSWLMDLENQR